MTLKRLLAVLAVILVYFAAAVPRPLFAPDEMRYAEMAREMLADADWTVPQLAGVPYFEKPAGGIWLIALSERLFGDSPFACRLPAVLATLLTAGVLWLLARRGGPDQPADLTAAVYLLTGLVFGVGTFLVLDPMLTLFVTLSMAMFYFAATEPRPGRRVLWLMLSGVGCGLAFLAKGLLAVALPALAAVPFLLWRREPRRIFTLPWIPLLTAALIAAPWSIAVHRADPDFWRQFLWVEHVQRAVSGQGANDDRSQPWWFYLPVLVGGAMPWTLLLPALWPTLRRNFRTLFQNDLMRFAACMAGPWFLAFSASSGKLGTYILPCFPALALIFARLLREHADRQPLRGVDRTLRFLTVLLTAAAATLGVWQLLGIAGWIPAGGVLYPAAAGCIPLFGIIAAIFCFRRAIPAGGGGRKFTLAALGILILMLFAHSSMPLPILRQCAPGAAIAELAAPELDGDTAVLTRSGLTASASWTLKRHDLAVYGSPGELRYGLERAEHRHRLVAPEDFADFVARHPRTVLITTSRKRVPTRPAPISVNGRGRLFVATYQPSVPAVEAADPVQQ